MPNAPWEGDLTPLPKDMQPLQNLVGAEVLKVGLHSSEPEGGLSIDYKVHGVVYRIILGYTELGEWISWQGQLGIKLNEVRTLLKKKLDEFDEVYRLLAIDQLKDTEVKGDPHTRSYHFFIDGSLAMTLTCSEIKILPINIRGLFKANAPVQMDHLILQLAVADWIE